MKPYVGSSLCAIAVDGSIDLPSFILAIACERSPHWLMFAGPDQQAPCLALFDEQTIARRLDNVAGDNGSTRSARRDFGFFEPAPFYSTGRLQLPALARASGWLGAEALVIGAGDRLEVWDPAIAAERGDGTVAALALLHRRLSAQHEDDVAPVLPLHDNLFHLGARTRHPAPGGRGRRVSTAPRAA